MRINDLINKINPFFQEGQKEGNNSASMTRGLVFSRK